MKTLWCVVPLMFCLAAADPAGQELAAMSKKALAETNAFREKGGHAGDPDDPARRWAETFWKFRQERLGTPAASQAARSALSYWRHADQDHTVIARAEELACDDPAWERAIDVFRDSARKTGEWRRFHGKVDAILQCVKAPAVRAAVLLALGHAYRDQHLLDEALKAYRGAVEAAPGLPVARNAEQAIRAHSGLLPGAAAPQFAATTTDGKRIALADFRGKVVLLVFWASW
jgi:tetratricopeptide (TPR) repeat protein